MPRPHINMRRRALTLDTGRRSIDVPVDGSGHLRRVAPLDMRAITRAVEEGQPIGFKGHAAVFDSRTWIGGKRWGFWEEMAPGAFAKTIGEADVRMLWNHDPNYLLARNKAGTLRLSEDAVGLAVDADMAPVSYAHDLAILLERGDASQMSFAFEMIGYEWRELDDGSEVLRHTEVRLWDVSPVTYPAYADTDAGLRAGLLAAARASGFDDLDLDLLGERFADPDPELISSLRALVRGEKRTPGAEPTSEQGPPAETTGNPTASRAHLLELMSRMSATPL